MSKRAVVLAGAGEVGRQGQRTGRARRVAAPSVGGVVRRGLSWWIRSVATLRLPVGLK